MLPTTRPAVTICAQALVPFEGAIPLEVKTHTYSAAHTMSFLSAVSCSIPAGIGPGPAGRLDAASRDLWCPYDALYWRSEVKESLYRP